MESKNYKVVPYKGVRYAIADENGKIVDNAQGYGYVTKYKANKVLWWKFKGGQQKRNKEKLKLKNWLKDKTNKKIYKAIERTIEVSFKEIARGETTMNEVFEEIEKEYSIELPDFVKNDILK